jgi:two-component system alkaline phosphatase synthesis response regulator PhoP
MSIEKKITLLLVEDDLNLGQSLVEILQQKNYQVIWKRSGLEFKEFIKNSIFHTQPLFDLILMDIGFPDANGLDLVHDYQIFFSQHQLQTCDIFFLSAQNTPDNRLESLHYGASEFISKPFHVKELFLKLERWEEKFKKKNFNLDPLIVSDQEILGNFMIKWDQFLLEFQIDLKLPKESYIYPLSKREGDILKILWLSSPSVVPREKVIHYAWGKEAMPSLRTVDNYIVRLRKIFSGNEDPKIPSTLITHPIVIENIRGVGYKLDIHN